jgi:hypothetical protein
VEPVETELLARVDPHSRVRVPRRPREDRRGGRAPGGRDGRTRGGGRGGPGARHRGDGQPGGEGNPAPEAKAADGERKKRRRRRRASPGSGGGPAAPSGAKD